MKIVILSPAFPFRGGIAASSERLAREFISLGHEVIFFTFTKQYPNLLFPGKTQFSESPAPEDLNIFRKIHSYNPFNWFKTARALRKINADLIVARYWIPYMAPSLGTIIKFGKAKTKAIGFVDNIIPHEKHFYDAFLSKYFVRQMDGFIVMSKSVQQELKQFISDQKVAYYPHPIYDIYGKKMKKEEARKKLQLDNGFKYILFFGFIRDYKGLDLLLKAMAEPILKNKNVKLIIAGEFYGNRKKYEELIEELEIRDKLVLKTDFIPDEEVKLYFSAADLLVQPYKTATQSGIAQIGYHFEIPMIVTNVGGLPEIVIDGTSGFVVEKDEQQIAAAIVRFYQDNKEAELVRGTKKLKVLFSWKNLAMGILDMT